MGFKGSANTAIGEVFGTFIIPNMLAAAARGKESPQDAVKKGGVADAGHLREVAQEGPDRRGGLGGRRADRERERWKMALAVEVRSLKKHYRGGDIPAVDGVNIATTDGEYLVLLGPSGCGKTTLLRTIAGLEEATEGEVLMVATS